MVSVRSFENIEICPRAELVHSRKWLCEEASFGSVDIHSHLIILEMGYIEVDGVASLVKYVNCVLSAEGLSTDLRGDKRRFGNV